MTRLLWSLLACGLLGCTEIPPSSPHLRAEPVSVVSAPLVQAAVETAAVEAAPAEPSDCVAQSGEDCEEVQLQLEAARRALARNQAERAQRPGEVNLLIRFVVNGRPLQLGQSYSLPVGALRVQAIRYWLSQLTFIAEDGRTTEIPDSYYLMEARGEQQLRGGTQVPITLPAKQRELIVLPKVATNAYTRIAFNVGVDATHNDDLSLTAGELTVLQNMASVQWMWFTSYIFTQFQAAIAGDVAEVQEDGGAPIDLAIYWENGSNQDLRRVELSLPSPASVGGDVPLTHIELELELATLFDGLQADLDTARTSSPSAPMSSIGAATVGPRTVLANNWSRAFRALRVGYGVR